MTPPLTVAEARVRRICRICRERVESPYGPNGWCFASARREGPGPVLVLDRGQEFAHLACLEVVARNQQESRT